MARNTQAERVIRSLEQIIEWRGKPRSIRCDNGPEYISGKLATWAEKQGIALAFIQPGKPQQNAYIERYNRTVRYDWLAQYLFDSTEEVQDYATRWLWFKAVCRSPVAVPTTKNCQKRPFITYRPPGDY